ncbi:MAG TPA: carboxypeptidase-like regulatory domain-containing protein [Acidobacteriaceae bacterium]|nr:carboxypeptidase-like regulatory domain-containing protein [Acidobacteriaceae bacterium]
MTQRFSLDWPRKDRPAMFYLPAVLCCFCLIACLSATQLHAQVENGINGTVMDKTGAVIPGAHVTVTNTSTGVVSGTVTSSAGSFTLVGLIPGSYAVSIDAGEFKTEVTTVTVEVAKMSTVSIHMEPGATSETVHVEEAAISLNTTSPVLGTTLEPELVKTAPIEINGLARQIDSFMFLAPGVQGNAGSHNINGGVNFENEVQFNGVPVAFVSYAGNQTYINPPYEMVNEFRVNSSTFDARFGLGQGAVTYNMASGTNQLHGDAFEILRNQLFDSSGFFPTRFSPDGHPTPPINQQNNYGFTVGGPVILPRIYNGKNRTFFHFSTDWFRQNQAQNSIGTVPTPAMKNGDFSNFVDSSGKQIPIFDPLTGKPFPGNVIPQARFSTLAKSLLPLIPDPDRAGIVNGLQSNKSPAVPSLAISQHLWGYTIDHNLSSSQSIHFSQWRDAITSPYFTSAPIVPATNNLQSEVNNAQLGSGFLLNYVKTISPDLVVTAGADWIGQITGAHNHNIGVSFPGVTGSITFPYIQFDGQNAPTSWGVSSNSTTVGLVGGLTVSNLRQLGIVLVNNWLWTKGRNTFNFGGQFRKNYQDILECQFCGGTFAFSQRTTSTPNASDPNFGTYGSSFASFLLGQVDGGVRIFSSELRMRSKAFAGYVQDDMKMTSRLTVNLGLRWDVMVPFTENNNQIIFMNLDNPGQDPGAGNLPGAASKFGNCAGCSGITRAAIHWKNLQPRVGFSYQITPNTVLQSGFYLTYLDGGAYEFGTAQSAFYMSSLLKGEFARRPTGGSTPAYGSWDAGPMPFPQPATFTPSIGNGAAIVPFTPKHAGASPYDQAWNVSVQRQLPWNMFLTAAYVGNRAIHLPVTLIQYGQPSLSVLQYGNLLGESVTSPDAVAAGIKVPYAGFVQQLGGSATVERALSPYPQYTDMPNIYEIDGTAFYNAFQAQGEKRFSNGLSYLASVTFSRNIANTQTGSSIFSPNAENSFNLRPEYTPSSLDQKYVTSFVATYNLPVGPGQRYLNSKGVLGQLLGGWQFSGILSYAGGNPMGPYNNYNPLAVNGFDRPNIVKGVPLTTYNYGRSKQYFTGKSATAPIQFSTSAFQNTGAWALGDAVRSYAALRTPPLRIENFDAIKSFHISDRVQASLRVDYFNAFNRTQLQAPDQNSSDSTFGQITGLSSQISNRQGQATFRVEF